MLMLMADFFVFKSLDNNIVYSLGIVIYIYIYIYVQKVALLARAIFSESFLLVSTRKGSLHNPLNKLFSLKCFLFFCVCIYICSCSWIYICIYISKRGFHIPENVSVFVCVFDQLRVRKSIYTSIYLFFLTLLVFYVCTVYTHDIVFCLLYIVYSIYTI